MAGGLAVAVVVACDGGEVKTGIIRLPHFRGVKQCKRMVVLRGFNLIISAFFGLVIHHDPCEDEPGYVLWYLVYDFSLNHYHGKWVEITISHPLKMVV